MALSLTPLSEAPTKESFSSAIANKPLGTKKRATKKLTTLAENPTSWVKMFSYGHTGTGKSFALVGLLLAGEKLLVLSTDFGGEGLNTVRNELSRIGRTDLFANIYGVDFDNYDEVEEFLKDPQSVFPDIYSVGITMFVWDGLTGFQQNHLATKVADMAPTNRNPSEARESGLQFEQTDWGMVRTGTMRPLAWFLNLHNKETGQKWHKYVTALEGVKENKTEILAAVTGPLLDGKARDLVGPMFDIIFQTKAKTKGEEREYIYTCVGHDRLLAKSRGFNLEPIEPANMQKLWGKITAQLTGEVK